MQEREQVTGSGFSRLIGFWTEERSLTLLLLLMVLHLFILAPGGRFLGYAFNLMGSFLLSLALLAGVLTLVRHRALRWLGTVMVAGTVVFKSVALIREAPWLIIGDTLFTLLSLPALLYVVFQQVSREGPVSAHRIRGAVALYLLIAMLFAFLYGFVEELAPGAFNLANFSAGGQAARGEAFYYFSIVTLTTVGFGDITAVHPLGRSLVMIEALIGQLYPAILIARLVSLELETRRGKK